MPLKAPTQVLKYFEGDRPAFLKNLNKAKGVQMLDLSELKRGTNKFDSGWYGLFPKWKPDKRLDGTVAAMVAATDDVQVRRNDFYSVHEKRTLSLHT